jgi:REP element-mobilizing transposase RayT
MPRPLRDAAAGHHHVVVGATGPETYYRSRDDRVTWLRMFIRNLDRFGWACVSFCEMTTHVHAIVETPDESLPIGMHRLNTMYGQYLNGVHGRKGALVRARYWSAHITTNAQMLAAFSYVALNPVRAHACARPEEWPWSSFATSCGLTGDFPFVDATIVCSLLDAGDEPAGALLDLVGFGRKLPELS